MIPKKILYTTTFYPPYHVGGACTHVYYLANLMASQGIETHVIYCLDSFYLKKKGKVNEKAYPNHKNLVLHQLKSRAGALSPLSSYITGFPLFKSAIKKLIDAEHFDFIHHHNISLLGPKIFEFGQCPKLYTSHDSWLVLKDGSIVQSKTAKTSFLEKGSLHERISAVRPPQLFRYTDMIRKQLRYVKWIICPSESMKELLLANKICPPEQIVVLPNFVPEARHVPQEIEKETGFFFFAGQVVRNKGILTLLKAFSDPGLDETLVIAGKGNLDSYVQSFIEKNRLEKKIRFIGWINHDTMYSYYSRAKAYILPSIFNENCPNGILEAMSVGTPSLGSDIGGIPELIKRMDPRFLFVPDDSDSMLKSIRYLSSIKVQKKDIRDVYDRYYSPAAFLENYNRLIASL